MLPRKYHSLVIKHNKMCHQLAKKYFTENSKYSKSTPFTLPRVKSIVLAS